MSNPGVSGRQSRTRGKTCAECHTSCLPTQPRTGHLQVLDHGAHSDRSWGLAGIRDARRGGSIWANVSQDRNGESTAIFQSTVERRSLVERPISCISWLANELISLSLSLSSSSNLPSCSRQSGPLYGSSRCLASWRVEGQGQPHLYWERSRDRPAFTVQVGTELVELAIPL